MSPFVTLVVALAASPALAAQSLVPPAAFEDLSEGRTLHFSLDGEPFGAEQFFPGRRSLWRYADEICDAGVWRPRGDAICFEYERSPGPVCWHFVETSEGYAATLIEEGAEAGLRLTLDRIETEPLPCPGPEVGS